MADVIGPCSTLPGASHRLPNGAMCDQHPDRKAVARIQGETDSFGAELNDFCQTCLDERRARRKSAGPRIGRCEWCDSTNVEVHHRRDIDEGMSGRVYDVCRSCINRDNAAIATELADMDERYGPLGDG